MGFFNLSTQATAPARRVAPSIMQRVELHPSVRGKEAASAGIEGFIIFEHGHGGLDRVQRGGSAAQQVVAHVHRSNHTEGMGLQLIGGNVPGAAMNQQYRRAKEGALGHHGRGMREVKRGELGSDRQWLPAPRWPGIPAGEARQTGSPTGWD